MKTKERHFTIERFPRRPEVSTGIERAAKQPDLEANPEVRVDAMRSARDSHFERRSGGSSRSEGRGILGRGDAREKARKRERKSSSRRSRSPIGPRR